MRTIESRGLSAGSLYKLLYIGLVSPLFLFGLGCGIASMFGHSTVSLNGHYVYGSKGLLTGTLLGIILPIILAALLWCLMVCGIWIWTRVKTINLTFID